MADEKQEAMMVAAQALVSEMERVSDQATADERLACVRAVCERCRAGEEATRTVARGWSHKLGGTAGLYGATVPCPAGPIHERGSLIPVVK